MEFRILGPIEALVEDAPLPLRGRPLELLTLLLIERGGVVHADRASDALWGDRTPADPRNALQVVVSRLRRVVGDERVAQRAGGYAIVLDPGTLDAMRFEQLLDQARRDSKAGAHATAADRLRAALALWRGPALADVSGAEFAQAEIARLEELRLEAIEARIDAELELGAGADLVAELQGLVAAHPLREGLRVGLMQALARAGRQADALKAFRDARATLHDELGLEPGERLQDLHRAILRQDPSRGGRAHASKEPFVSDQPEGRGAVTLPSTPLVGRTSELSAVTGLLLRAGRVLTLCGPGGAGKTRLALHVAHGLESVFTDGVVTVDLAPLHAGSEVVGEVARALTVDAPSPGEPLETITSRAAGRRLLVLLDNAEHVLDGARKAVAALLAVEGPQVLATSREPLGLESETCYEVPPLSPADGVAMFTVCARRIDPTFDPDDATPVVCARLDWLPLAIELAAARTRLFSPAQLLELLGERLDVLDAGPRADPRHRTLRATIDWSVALLEPAETRLFRRLSVFAGDVSWDAVHAVCSPTPDALAALVEQHLVQRTARRHRSPRFGMLDTIRHYASELLAQDPTELEECRRRHGSFVLARARELADEQGAMLELEELRPELACALAAARDEVSPQRELELVAATHQLWRLRGPYDEGIAALGSALARAGTRDDRAPVLLALADLASLHGDPARGCAIAEEALGIARNAGDRRVEVRALNLVGNAAFAAGDLGGAADAYRQAIELERPSGVTGYLLAPLSNLGHTLLELGDLDAARRTLDECLVACVATEDRRRASACLHSLGLLALHEGRLAEAEEALVSGLVIAAELGVVKYQIDILDVLGATRVQRGDLVGGVHLLACAEAQGTTLGLTPDPEGSVARGERLAAVQAALEAVGPGAFEAAYTAGRAMRLEDLVAATVERPSLAG